MINDFCFSDQSYGGWKWDYDYEGKVYDVRKFNDFDSILRIYILRRLTRTNACGVKYLEMFGMSKIP